MAFAYIKESKRFGSADYSTVETQAVLEPPLNEQKLAIGLAIQSDAFDPETRVVEISVDAICHYKFGEDPTAGTSNQRLPADTIITRSISKEDAENGFKISIVSGS